MLDPAWIGLIGVGAGGLLALTGSVVTSLITTGRSRADKRRDLTRAAYLQGLAAISALNRCATPQDWITCSQQVFDAQIQIRLDGSTRASEAYDAHAAIVQQYIDIVRAELAKKLTLKPAERRADDAFAVQAQERFRETHKAFVNAARRDLGMGTWK